MNEPLRTDLASSPVCCSSLSLWEGSMFQSTEPGTQREVGQAVLLGCSHRYCYRVSTSTAKGLSACCFDPHPPHILCSVVPPQTCAALQITAGCKTEQGATWLKRRKGKHHLKRVLWHNCRVLQPRSRSPGCEGLWWWLEWLRQVSEKPQLCTLVVGSDGLFAKN